jgi:two-component system CheB/CheR fusion protein
MLVDILSRATAMPVCQAADGVLVEPDRVYVMPPNTALHLSEGALRVTLGAPGSGPRMLIDRFLRSLAEDRKNKAIGVILSGTGSDGAEGLRAIRAQGGVTFAEDQGSAKFGGMPQRAVATGCVDFVMPPEAIAQELARMANQPWPIPPTAAGKTGVPDRETAPDDLSQVFVLLLETTGVDFSLYRQATIQRRIRRRQTLLKAENLRAYVGYLREHPEEIRALHQEILIRVTRFFRDPEAFQALREQVFPQLLERASADSPIRLWVPGCATGEEAYSLAMSLTEFLEETASKIPIQVFATDINQAVIDVARAGSYSRGVDRSVGPERLRRFFTQTDRAYQIGKEIRDKCVFAKQDLLNDPPYSKLDLISCRNVLIYLGPALQERVIPLFHYALKPMGFLMLGTAETAGAFSDLFTLIDKKHKLHSRKDVSPRAFPRYASASFASLRDDLAGPEPKPVREEPRDASVFQRLADRITIENYGPAAVIVGDDHEIVEIRGRVEPYLQPVQGKASLNLLKMARGAALSIELHAAIEKAKKDGGRVRKEAIPAGEEAEIRFVNIEVFPLQQKDRRTFLVIFDELPPSAPKAEDAATAEETLSADEQALRQRDLLNTELKQDLAETRARFLALIGQYASANEESQSAQEEFQSSIEELQSLNEELETTKEELQATNEELTTVNDELQTRNVELGQSRDFTRSIVQTIQQPLLVLNTDLIVNTANGAFHRCFQSAPGTTEGRPLYEIEGGRFDSPDLRTLLEEVLPKKRAFRDFELAADFANDGHKVLLIGACQLDAADMILLSIDDITERRNSERAFRRAEDHLRQAQKMAAMGRLAGGVAHDFNNILTVILGYSDMLASDLPASDPHYGDARLIRESAQRAASLTQQLLAFSRKQVLQPKVVDLNEVITDLDRMLRRLIGENIELVTTFEEALGPIRADPGQIGQVVMNLALNARDAMPNGGRLTIETRNVDVSETAAGGHDLEPGRYVMLAVGDSGVGMDAETKARVFEPFFTTKGQRVGTGLGLSTVYGIVEQSGAQIRFSSELALGTTFWIYFPRLTEQPRTHRQVVSLAHVPRGTEVVLVAEDEDRLRQLTRTFLEGRGYTVLEAKDGGEGIAICENHQGPIHLLLTDVVMPRVGGRELAERATALRPEMKILFMSGYTEDALLHDIVETERRPFLHKPFTLEELARSVRALFDA